MKWAAALAAAGALALPPPASSADLVFTVAGGESTSVVLPSPCNEEGECTVPRGWPPAWTATDRGIAANCVARLADGTILLCQGTELIALGTEGRMRRWLPADTVLGLGELLDADAATDGTVVVVGRQGVARVAGGVVIRLVPPWVPDQARSDRPFGSAIAAGADGSVLLAGEDGRPNLVRLAADGARSVVRSRLPVGPRLAFRDFEFDSVATLPDGAAVLAFHGSERVLRVDAQGGARVFADHLGAVSALSVRPDGDALVAADRGLFVVSPERPPRRLASGPADRSTVTDPRELTTDGRRRSRSVIGGVIRLDAVPGGGSLALIGGSRVITMAPLLGSGRLSVALPATNRASLGHGVLDVLATRAAHAEIEIRYGASTLRRVSTSLRAGHNPIRIHVPQRSRALIAQVTAWDPTGAVASHRLAFLSGEALSSAELRRLIDVAEDNVGDAVSAITIDRCTRGDTRSATCRWRIENDVATTRGTAAFRRRPNGLIRYTVVRHGGTSTTEWLEPR